MNCTFDKEEKHVYRGAVPTGFESRSRCWLLALGLIALVGAPQVASADGGCDYYVYDCVDTAGECVENLHESCPAVGECQYEHQCRPSFEYPDCPLHEYIMTCEEEEPN